MFELRECVEVLESDRHYSIENCSELVNVSIQQNEEALYNAL